MTEGKEGEMKEIEREIVYIRAMLFSDYREYISIQQPIRSSVATSPIANSILSYAI